MILAVILAVLGLIHVYWGSGGTWGAANAIPRLEGGRPAIQPGIAATAAVAGLLFFGAAISAGWILQEQSGWLMKAMAAVFALRAIGEFRYVGFFKRVRNSPFAYWDTRLYSPLCAAMAVLAYRGY